jgi:DNA invertase Pin-like site-specific DNA recombinase
MKETLHCYTRVSTRVQEQGASLDTQKELGVKKAKDLGYKHKIWNEGSASSHHEDLTNRPVLQELLGQIEDGLVKHLYVYNNDRLSRQEDTQYTIRYALTKNGVRLYTKDGQFDLNNPQDKLLKGMMDEIAQYENTLRAERSRLGRIAKSKQNYYRGGQLPYGWMSVDKQLVPHPEESKWVKRIFGWKYNGKSTQWIKGQLDSKGVLARRGGLFSTGSIDRMLEATHHKGFYSWTDKKSGETIDCTCDPIVDETIWNAIAEKRKEYLRRKNQKNRTKKFYLMRDLMVCGHCGSNIRGDIKPLRRSQIYYCPKKQRDWKKGPIADDDKWKRGKVGENGCSMNRSLNIPIAENHIWDVVMDVVSRSSLLKQGFKDEVLQTKFKGDKDNERLLQNEKKKTSRLKKELKQVQSSLAEVETNKLLNKYDPVVYEQIKVNLDAEMQKKKDQLEQTRIRTKNLGDQKSWLDWIGKYGDDLTLKSDLRKEDKQEYLEGLLDRIEVRLDNKTNDHTLKVFFRMGLVGDGIEYVDPNRKGAGYKVIEGKKNTSVVISHEETKRIQQEARITGRKEQVKKNDTTCHQTKSIYNCGIVLLGGKKPTNLT